MLFVPILFGLSCIASLGFCASNSEIQLADQPFTPSRLHFIDDDDDKVNDATIQVNPRLLSRIRRSLRNDVSREALLQHLIASTTEFLGTTLFAILVLGSVNTLNTGSLSPEQAKFFIALSVGFALTVSARLFGNSFFNPGIAISKFLVQEITAVRGLFLTIAQYAGAMSGAAIIKLLTQTLRTAPSIAGDTSLARAHALETIGTAAFVFTVLMITSKKHIVSTIGVLEVGLSLFINVLLTSGYTGGSLNSALALASESVTHEFPEYAWLYQTSNWVGGALAAGAYRLIHELALLQSRIDPEPSTGIDLAVAQVEAQLPLQRRKSMAFSIKDGSSVSNIV